MTKTFTLYFVPLFPLGVLGEHLECKVCGTTFLDGDDEPAFAKAALRVMTKMLLADGVVAEEEVLAIGRIQEELTGAPIERAAIERAIADARVDAASLHATIDAIAPRLNAAGKEQVLRAAYRVAVADGTFHEDEERLLGEIAASLEMTPRHFADVIHALSP